MLGIRKTVPIEQIDPGEPLYPLDEVFIYLFERYLVGALQAHQAMIDRTAIDPHADYRPDVPPELVAEVQGAINRGDSPLITVYPRQDRFVMSDDYSIFFAYEALGLDAVPCLVLGPAVGPGVRYAEAV